MNPWLAEQLVASRRSELERSARTRRVAVPHEIERAASPVAGRLPRRAAQHLGGLLIGLGRRLVGPDGWSEALDG
jgi:hypothetical protein